MRLRESWAPLFLTVLCGALVSAMQRSDSEQTPKRPRLDNSHLRTPPNTPAAAAAESAGSKLHHDRKTWGPEQVCDFLIYNDFKDPKVLDRFRGSRGRGLGVEAGTAGLRERE